MRTPTVFLSAASDDLKDWRDVLHKAFEGAGCHVFTQGHTLGVPTGDVLKMLRQKLDQSEFVIHLAGLACGGGPDAPAFPEFADFRCSYTQFEYYYARQGKKHLITFVCAADFPYLRFTEKGTDDAEREQNRLSQLAHRERLTTGRFTGTPFDDVQDRPLSQAVPDVRHLLQSVAAAVGTIRDTSETWVQNIQRELHELAAKRHDELIAYLADMPSRVADELERRRLVRPAFEFKADISRIVKYAPAELIGRESETKLLQDAWNQAVNGEKKRTHVLTFVALGGEGKTSLVAKWAAELAHQDWPGCDAVFAWSFDSQGTREQVSASSDVFLKEALTFFGDAALAGSAQGAFDKGKRLAQLVGEQRALLILDGLEPLQYAPGPPMRGKLKDEGIAVLLKGLAAASGGLCVVTTSTNIPDLDTFKETTVLETELKSLSRKAGADMLQKLGVKGSLRRNIPFNDGKEMVNEFEKLVEDVHGQALTLNLLGSYLRDAHAGDIRRRDLVKLEEADAEEQGGHSFRVVDADVQAFESGGKTAEEKAKGRRALALLELLGLFDRPATADCLNALWQGEAIAGLTEPLIGLSEAQRNLSLTRLQDAKLLTVNRDEASGVLVSLDAHPLLREYFAKRLREQQPEA